MGVRRRTEAREGVARTEFFRPLRISNVLVGLRSQTARAVSLWANGGVSGGGKFLAGSGAKKMHGCIRFPLKPAPYAPILRLSQGNESGTAASDTATESGETMAGIRISKRARREICDATGGIWMVFDRAGNVAAYGTPADYQRALRTAQAMADRNGVEYLAIAQPTVAECEAGFRAGVAS